MSSYEVGSVFTRVGALFDKKGFDQFDRAVEDAETTARRTKIEAALGGNFDDSAFQAYDAAVKRAQARSGRREAIKAQLGGDFDPRAFNAYERHLDKAERRARSAAVAHRSLSDELDGLSVRLPRLGGLMGQLKWPAMITGAGLATQALSAASAGAIALGSSLAPLSGALAAYPALGSAAAQGMGVFKLATANVFEAVGGLNQRLDTSSKAFRELDPQAKRLAVTLDHLKQPIRDLQKTAQHGLFPGLEQGIKDASRNLPILNRIVDNTAKAMGRFAVSAGQMVGSKAWGRDFALQGERNVRWMERGGNIALRLANVLRNVTIAAGPMVNWMTLGAERGARWLDVTVRQGRETGKLGKFFDETRIAMSRVVRIGQDLAVAFFNIGKAGKPLGDEILVNLVKAADQFRKWTDSTRGRNAIAEYFRQARPAIFEVGRLVRDVGAAFFRLGRGDQVAPLIRQIRTQLLPVIESTINSTTKAFGPPLINAITQVLRIVARMSGTNGPLTQTIILVGRVAEGINHLLDRFPQFQSLLVTMIGFGGLYRALGIASTLTGLGSVLKLVRQIRTGMAISAGAEAAGAAAAGGRAAGGAASQGALASLVGAAVRRFGIRGAIGRAGAVGAAVDLVINLRSSHGNLLAASVNAAHDLTFGIVPSIKVKDEASAGLKKVGDQLQRLKDRADIPALRKFAADQRAAAKEARDFGNLPLAKKYDQVAAAADTAARGINQSWGRTLPAVNRDVTASMTLVRNQAVNRLTEARKSVGSNSDQMARSVHGAMNQIRSNVASNTAVIKQRLTDDPAAARAAVSREFRLAAKAIDDSMTAAGTRTREGAAQIRSYTIRALTSLGLTRAQAQAKLDHGTLQLTSERVPGGGAGRRQRGGYIQAYKRGGWIGGRGEAGPDDVMVGPNAVAARGEFHAAGRGGVDAILNRHQQPIAERALLARGGITLDDLAGLGTSVDQVRVLDDALRETGFGGGLSALFQRVTRAHSYQSGGGLKPAVANFAHMLERKFGLVITSTTGGTHVPGSYHYQGLAADLGGSGSAMEAASQWIKTSGAYHSLLEGIHNPNLAVKNGHLFSGAGPFGSVWAAHRNHVHVALSAIGSILGGVPHVRPPRMNGPGGINAMVDASWAQQGAAANQVIQAVFDSMGGGDITDMGMSGGNNAANQALAQRMAAARGWVGGQWTALKNLWTRESNFNDHATNASSGAYGIPQALPASKMATAGRDYRTNPATQIQWGLDYIRGRYGTPGGAWAHEQAFNWYGRGGAFGDGGLLQRFAGGGNTDTPADLAFARTPKRGVKARPVRRGRFANTVTVAGTVPNIRSLVGRVSTGVHDFDVYMQDVEDDGKRYTEQDRKYNLTDEVLIDPKDGSVNTAAVKRRAYELEQLINIRFRIQMWLVGARRTAQRVVSSLRTILRRLNASLKYASRKQRAGIRAQIKDYRSQLGDWTGKAHDLGFDIADAKLDVAELQKEKGAVLGTTADTTAAPDAAPADTGAVDAGTATAPPTASDIAAAVAHDMQSFLAEASNVAGSYGSNYATRLTALGAGGAYSGHPDAMGAAFGGERFFGAGTSGLGGRAGAPVTIVNNYNQLPDNTATWAQQMRFQVERVG